MCNQDDARRWPPFGALIQTGSLQQESPRRDIAIVRAVAVTKILPA